MSTPIPYDEIIVFADFKAKELKEKFKDKPVEEFFAWLRVGLQREFLVAEAYKQKYIKEQIRKLHLDDEALERKIMESIGTAWAQEKSHQAYVAAVLLIITPRAKIFYKNFKNLHKAIKGKIEATVINSLQSGNKVKHFMAKLAIAFGRQSEDIPAFFIVFRDNLIRDNEARANSDA
jgi:hypothetical protein